MFAFADCLISTLFMLRCGGHKTHVTCQLDVKPPKICSFCFIWSSGFGSHGAKHPERPKSRILELSLISSLSPLHLFPFAQLVLFPQRILLHPVSTTARYCHEWSFPLASELSGHPLRHGNQCHCEGRWWPSACISSRDPSCCRWPPRCVSMTERNISLYHGSSFSFCRRSCVVGCETILTDLYAVTRRFCLVQARRRSTLISTPVSYCLIHLLKENNFSSLTAWS